MCNLSKHINQVATHWVGITGKLYCKEKYHNHGKGGIYKNKIDLPANEYPYRIKYSYAYHFKCCALCTTCVDKHTLPSI